jgi:hypothetical protein
MSKPKIVFTLCALFALTVGVATAAAGSGNSANAKMCQKGGWMGLVGADGTTFSNDGACVSYGAHGGTYAAAASGQWIIPAGHTATVGEATLCGADQLSYGYQLNLGADIPLGADNSFSCAPFPDTVLGPFPTAVLLRMFLRDTGLPPGFVCDYTYYSDGLHAAVSGSNPYSLDIDDSLFCQSPPTDPRTGNQNFTATITIS